MNSSPSPYLKVTRRQSTQRGMSTTSSCSTLTHSTGPMPGGELEDLGLGEGRRREEAAIALPDERRVEALLDRRPDGEASARTRSRRSRGSRRRARRPRRSRRRARRRRGARRRRTGRAPRRCRRARAGRPAPSAAASANCSSPSFTPGSSYGRSGCGPRQGHRHVEVGAARGEARPGRSAGSSQRVAGVEDRVGAARRGRGRPPPLVARVDGDAVIRGSPWRATAACARAWSRSATTMRSKKAGAARDGRDGRPDAARAQDEDAHAVALRVGAPRRRRARRPARPACAQAASTSGSAPSRRSSALVTGPIETSRGPYSEPAASWKKRTADADAKVR